MVHTRLYDSVQTFLELGLVDVVLILANANRLRIRLDQLRQRILQTPSDTDRTADGNVQIRKLFHRDVAGRVDRRTGFADHHASDRKFVVFD